MMEETQRQNGVRRSSLVPHEEREEDDAGGNERRLDQPDFSFTEIHKRPHQTAAADAGEESAREIETSDALPDALAHSGDDEESRHDRDRDVDQECPAP